MTILTLESSSRSDDAPVNGTWGGGERKEAEVPTAATVTAIAGQIALSILPIKKSTAYIERRNHKPVMPLTEEQKEDFPLIKSLGTYKGHGPR